MNTFAYRLFCSYAPEDEQHLFAFDRALVTLKRLGLVNVWSYKQVPPGAILRDAIKAALDAAHIFVMLVSSSFIGSDDCWNNEMTPALERRGRGEVRVVPVLVGPCLLDSTPLADLKPLPENNRPVVSWANQDEAWASVAIGINALVKDMQFEELQKAAPKTIRDKPIESVALRMRTLVDGIAALSKSQTDMVFSADELMRWGDARFVSGNIEEAIGLYRKAISSSPETAIAWHRLAFALDEGYSRLGEALRFYDVAISLDATLVEAHIDRSYVLRHLGRFAESIASAARALELDVENARAAYNLACSQARAGNQVEAIASLSKAIALNPKRYGHMAAHDPDFSSINKNQTFRQLAGLRQ